jgi:hypothetical protein
MELDFLPDAGCDAGEDEGKASSDDSEEQLITPGSAVGGRTTDVLDLAKKTPTSAPDLGPGKTKRWRANIGCMPPYPQASSTTS